jgi:hypothetical protein
VREPGDLSGQTALAGFEHPAFGLGEAREVEVEEFVEGPFGLIEAGLKVAGGGPERRGGRRGRRRDHPGIAQQRLAGQRIVRRPPGREHSLRLARAQPVARDGVGQPLLLAARQTGERGGRRGREPAGVDVRGHLRRQAAAEQQAPLDPAAAAVEQLPELRRREAIVVGERPDDARLVHRAQRAPGRVRRQEPRLQDHARGVFEHDGHLRGPGVAPLREALEAVEHLVRPRVGRGDAQRQRGERAGAIRARAAQRRQRRRQLRDRERQHRRRHGRGSTGSTWESGYR